MCVCVLRHFILSFNKDTNIVDMYLDAALEEGTIVTAKFTAELESVFEEFEDKRDDQEEHERCHAPE